MWYDDTTALSALPGAPYRCGMDASCHRRIRPVRRALCRSLAADGVAFVPVVRNARKWRGPGCRAARRGRPGAAPHAAPGADGGGGRGVLRPCPPRAGDPGCGAGRGAPLRVPRQHPQVHPLAGRPCAGRAGRGAGLPQVLPPRRDAAPDDDLRRAGRGQRAPPRPAAEAPAVRAAARRRRGDGAADPPGRRDALHPRRHRSRVAPPGIDRGRRGRPGQLRRFRPRGGARRRVDRRPASSRVRRPVAARGPLTRLLPGVPTVRRDEIRRLGEDKTFGIEAMRRYLGVEPIGLAEGLARTFAPELTARAPAAPRTTAPAASSGTAARSRSAPPRYTPPAGDTCPR